MTIRRVVAPPGDVVVAAALAAVFVGEILVEGGFAGHRGAALSAALAFSASLALRRTAPVLPPLLALGVIELANLAGPQALAETGAFLFGIVVAIYSAGAYATGRQLVAAAVLVAAAIPLAAIEPGQSPTPADLGFFATFVGGPFVAGRVIRRRRA